jgi:hypothetical protein
MPPDLCNSQAPASNAKAQGLSFRALTALIVVVALCSLAYPPLPVLTLMADSSQYRAMSQSLLDGTFFQPVDISHVGHLATIMRPPLFPLLLATASLIPGVPLVNSVLVIHLFLALAMLLIIPYLLRSVVAPPITALACGLSLYSAKQVLWGEMSEWLATSCLLFVSVSYLRWLKERRNLDAFSASLFASLAILTRSALSPWLIVLPVIVAQAPPKGRRATAVALLLGLFPLVVWASIQFHRLGTFSLGAYEGLNLVATARSLGEIPARYGDAAETELVISRINERGVTTSDAGLQPPHVHEWDGEFYAAFHHNFDQVCAAIQSIATLEIAHREQPAAVTIALRGLATHKHRYASFLRGGVETFLREYALLLLTCLAIGMWLRLRGPNYRPLATASITISLVCLLYVASIFFSILWLHRYFVPIQVPLLFLSLLSLLALCLEIRSSKASGSSCM